MNKQIFLEDLPKTSRGIDWRKSVGYTIKFIYGGNQFEIDDDRPYKYTIAMVDWIEMIKNNGFNNKCNNEFISWLI